ncbi:MAG: transglutaminase family protein [Methylovirgula sp.]|uniref:transglutaminase-like domain-containing protein n=1 Tax=Methylovirgula sp. TaxID=1978224 RepID=UPI0030764941
MLIRYGFNIEIELTQPAAVVTAMDVHSSGRGGILRERDFRVSQPVSVGTFTDGQGNVLRRFNAQPGRISLDLDGVYACDGGHDIIDVNADITPVNDVPLDALPFLQGSRYCETDLLSDLAWRQFGGIRGGWAKVQAVCDFVHNTLYFDYQAARPTRTAAQALEEGTGVCRDFTHLAMTLCRCLNIPARYCNGYLGDIGVPPDPAPMDFNAWFEAYLGGRWYTFDPRHNIPRIGRILIARGRDAMDIPMLTTYGPHWLNRFAVMTEEIIRVPVAA